MSLSQLISAMVGLLLWFFLGVLVGNLGGWQSGFNKGYLLGRGKRGTRIIKKEIITYEDSLSNIEQK